MVPSGRTRGKRHKVRHTKLPLNLEEKIIFEGRVGKHRHRLPRVAVESPSLASGVLRGCPRQELFVQAVAGGLTPRFPRPVRGIGW